jgi:tRNA pseudouridine32 synthase/23S rRNA pseudouridine746 synthase
MDFSVLHSLSDFGYVNRDIDRLLQSSPTYWYEGICPKQGELLRLPRTAFVESIAHGLMQQLDNDDRFLQEGKMYGVLLVQLPWGELRILKAFSGLLNGKEIVEGWIPPIAGREQVAIDEAWTLAQLESIKQELIALHQIPERQQYQRSLQEFNQQLHQRSSYYRERKQQRQAQRQLLEKTVSGTALLMAMEQLNEQSRQDGIEQRRWKQQQSVTLRSLKQIIDQADTCIQVLKQQRKDLSRQLQSQLHRAYCLTNFAGETLSLEQVVQGAMPTGTGNCCAPKLLHYAAAHQLQPIALAEFWYGPASPNGDKQPGDFYGACTERCQPLMGFLLSGATCINSNQTAQTDRPVSAALSILYEDEWLIAVNKPAGLLAVPGRYASRQDSVLSRLQTQKGTLQAVHRLDQATSGILLLARTADTHCQLSQQFQQRQVDKIYEAILNGVVDRDRGIIDLPLWGNPVDRPRQQVNWQCGKPSVTQFQVIARYGSLTHVEFRPVTGRTHQLRVHAADPQGLGTPILGDRLYGCQSAADRLHLHARELRFEHPHLKQILHLQADTPFIPGQTIVSSKPDFFDEYLQQSAEEKVLRSE